MTTFTVTVDGDHLYGLAKRPVLAIAELIWNALDADANNVTCKVAMNAMNAVEAVTIQDDGTGIKPEEVQARFGQLGGSWKKLANGTEMKRSLHGSEGKGRYAAYGIGDGISWSSVATDTAGQRQRTTITGRSSRLNQFDVVAAGQTDDDPGTLVQITGVHEKAGKSLEAESVADSLTSIFALFLEKYPVTIRWRNHILNPAAIQQNRTEVPLSVDDVKDGEISLVIIEWTVPQPRALHLCDASGASLHEMQPGIQAPGFDFSAYIRWDGFREMGSQIMLAEMGQEPVTSILDEAKAKLRRHFRERAGQRSSELVRQWKAENSYPYSGAAQNDADRAERDLFDVVALAASPIVQEINTRARSLSLRLLRQALEGDPSALNDVLQNILELPADRLDELRLLLRKTTLTAMIATSRSINNRLDFLSGLELLVFDPKSRRQLLERSQLHKILAQETWTFAEEYALTGNDQSLHTLLKKHVHLLGREDLEGSDLDADVLDEDGHRVIPDLMLSRVLEHSDNQREHIVIELKRPSVNLGDDEINQIQKYANAVIEDERFSDQNVRWDFWLVSNKLTKYAKALANQRGRAPGVLYEHDSRPVTIRAVPWSDIIQDARHRLKYVQDTLDYTGGQDEAIEYLRATHAKYLPEALAESAEVESV